MLQLFQRGLYADGVELRRLVAIQLIHAVEVALQLEPLTCRIDAGHSAELASINCDSFSTD
jgi:hypothetical protein